MTSPVPARPYPYPLAPGRTALIVIDMQRDFVEPGGFGEALGNDVARLRTIVPTVAALLGAVLVPRAGRSSTRARRTCPTCRTARRPSAIAARLPCASTKDPWAACSFGESRAAPFWTRSLRWPVNRHRQTGQGRFLHRA